MNGTSIQKFLAVLKQKKILGNICFSERIFYRKQSLGAPAKCLLMRVFVLQGFVIIAKCLLTINIQRLLCTVIKLHVVKEVIQSSNSFHGRNPILLLSIQSDVSLIEVFNDRNQPNTTYFSVRVRLIEMSAEQGLDIKGNIRRSFRDQA